MTIGSKIRLDDYHRSGRKDVTLDLDIIKNCHLENIQLQ